MSINRRDRHGVVFLHDGVTQPQKGRTSQEHLTQAATCVGLQDVRLRKTSPSQKDKYCVTPPTRGPWASHIQRDGREEVGAGGWGRGGSV